MKWRFLLGDSRGPLLALVVGMFANAESIPVLARLHAALDSLEATRDLIRQVRQVESFRTQRSELRSADELVAEAQSLVQRLVGVGR